MSPDQCRAALEGGQWPATDTIDVPEDVFDLLDEFVDSTTSELDELEEVVLVYEQEQTEDQAATIRRVLHKMKGEAGIVRFSLLETFFHEAENAFEQLPIEARSEMLLRLKDWVADVIAALER